MAKCEDKLIVDHKDVLLEYFQNLFDLNRVEGKTSYLVGPSLQYSNSCGLLDLQRMYALLSRVDNGLEPLRLNFEGHIKTSGLNAVSKILGESGVDNLVRPPFFLVQCLTLALEI